MFTTLLIIVLAIGLDWLIGEPKRWHPLVGFGRLAHFAEQYGYGNEALSNGLRVLRGLVALSLLLVPIVALSYVLTSLPIIGTVISVLLLTLAIGHKSLHEHTTPIVDALISGDETKARELTSRIVSRDPATLNIPRAATESILENGADSVFCTLFWFIIGGAPAVVAYRLANTLDAMWGYRNERYIYFGRAAARLDDIMNFIPARLTALSYSLLGDSKQAFRAWKHQAKFCDSPNAGPVMAAGAGALNLRLGGPAQYDGQWHARPQLGYGKEPEAEDIYRALKLVRHGVLLWLICLSIIAGLSYA